MNGRISLVAKMGEEEKREKEKGRREKKRGGCISTDISLAAQ